MAACGPGTIAGPATFTIAPARLRAVTVTWRMVATRLVLGCVAVGAFATPACGRYGAAPVAWAAHCRAVRVRSHRALLPCDPEVSGTCVPYGWALRSSGGWPARGVGRGAGRGAGSWAIGGSPARRRRPLPSRVTGPRRSACLKKWTHMSAI
ncbi:hypothetical protein GCM10027203_35280 [Nonomuraea fastidiosa]